MKKRLCIFASGNGTNMQAILDDIDNGNINGEVVLLITSVKNTGAADRAIKRNIPVSEFLLKDFQDATMRDQKIVQVMKEYSIDYIILAGYLGILTKELISKYPNKIINIHPALLPKFGGKGMYGLNVHRAVIAAREEYSGATVHFVDEGTDTGAVILQEKLKVNSDDDEFSLQQRILTQIEHKIFPLAVKLLCEDKIKVVNNKVVIL